MRVLSHLDYVIKVLCDLFSFNVHHGMGHHYTLQADHAHKREGEGGRGGWKGRAEGRVEGEGERGGQKRRAEEEGGRGGW